MKVKPPPKADEKMAEYREQRAGGKAEAEPEA
jgi:hypothetical protein